MNTNERENLVRRLTDAVAYELELSELGAAGAANAIRDARRSEGLKRRRLEAIVSAVEGACR